MKKINTYKNNKGEALTVTILGLCAIFGIFLNTKLSLKNLNPLDLKINNNKNKETNYTEEIILPTFNSKEEILEMIGDGRIIPETDGMIFDLAVNEVALPNLSVEQSKNEIGTSTNASTSKPTNTNNTDEFSTTNTQVQGVDEADIVKTNGNFIYYISNSNLYIFDTQTTTTKLVKTIKFEDASPYSAQELYIDDNYITVIMQEYSNEISNRATAVNRPINLDRAVTSMYVYDINSYELLKTVKTEGNYVSSRKINNNVYLVTNRYLYSYRVNEDNILPIYFDSVASVEPAKAAEYQEIAPQDIKYFPGVEKNKECNYMIITAIDLSNLESQATIDTYLGAGTEIYCSKENLYVAKIDYKNRYYGFISIDMTADMVKANSNSDSIDESEDKVTTQIHRFKLLDGAVKYVATGEVPGALLNQYSMDENKTNFRITTTSEKGNSLYVLNEKLEIIGKLQNLAKGEKIYATRFMGDKCYVVTYKTVDPLFVIDLSTPTNPTVLGELKIPGYSKYLHPLGENYLIGFGEDSVEKSYLNWEGQQDVIAYNTGLKLAIFDVADVNNPKEVHSIKIGGRGSSSELLNNPKVLYFDEEKEIFAFPAILTEETKFYQDGTPMYGKTIFNGALVYNLSVENGISLRGKIEHKTLKELENYKNIGYKIERIISIGDNFYTISPNMIKVTNMETMQELKEGTCDFKNK